jgi:hypothetical protein
MFSPTLKHLSFFLLLLTVLLLATSSAFAQDKIPPVGEANVSVTTSATSERVRFSAPSAVVQLRLEVYDGVGQKLIDTEQRGGNVLDWHLQGSNGERVAEGTYLCVVTIKSLSGRLSQKLGSITVSAQSTVMHPASVSELSPQQAQAVGPVESGEEGLTVVPAGDAQPITVLANNAGEAQLARTRGALTFRVGDFFSGNDEEQMRLTEDGRLGVGTSNPQAKLDVAGAIRAQRFLVAKPINSASDLKAQVTDAADSVQPLVAGTGTQDRITKWTDNAGTLGNSGITETAGGFVGIGTTAPGSKLVVSSNTATLPSASGVARFADADGVQTAVFADAFGTNPIFNVRRANGTAAAPSAVQANQLLGVIGASGYGASAYMGTRARVAFVASENWTNTANGSYLTFNTTANGAATAGGAERLRIDNAGNVGIGTTTPASKLDVAGDVNVTGNAVIAGNIAAKYQDVAEWVQARKPIAPGTLVILDPGLPNAVVASGRAYDTHVAGVVSARPGLILGENGAGKVLVATTGRVKVKVDATRHPINIGDLLVTSDKSGVAMKSLPIRVRGVRIHRPGTIVGKALEPLAHGRGSILVLLSLQ